MPRVRKSVHAHLLPTVKEELGPRGAMQPPADQPHELADVAACHHLLTAPSKEGHRCALTSQHARLAGALRGSMCLATAVDCWQHEILAEMKGVAM